MVHRYQIYIDGEVLNSRTDGPNRPPFLGRTPKHNMTGSCFKQGANSAYRSGPISSIEIKSWATWQTSRFHGARNCDTLRKEGCHGEHDGTGKERPLLRGQNQMTAPQLPLTRIVPVIAHAVGVFGDEHKASHLVVHPAPALWRTRSVRTLGN